MVRSATRSAAQWCKVQLMDGTLWVSTLYLNPLRQALLMTLRQHAPPPRSRRRRRKARSKCSRYSRRSPRSSWLRTLLARSQLPLMPAEIQLCKPLPILLCIKPRPRRLANKRVWEHETAKRAPCLPLTPRASRRKPKRRAATRNRSEEANRRLRHPMRPCKRLK